MSKLDELIQDLCPDGVEYKILAEISNYSDSRVDASYVDSYSYVGVDNLVSDKKGKTNSSYVPTDGRLTHFAEGDILIGNIRPYLKKIWLAEHDGGTNGDVLVVKIKNPELVSAKFLFYVLSSDQFFIYDMRNAKGAKMPRGDKSAIMKYRMPLPPVPVQREIVRILDSFTELTAELTVELEAELTARKKQYENFRDVLLAYDNNVEWKALGEICNLSAGGDVPSTRFSKTKTKEYTVPIYSNGIGNNALYGYTNICKIQKSSVTISARGTIGYSALRKESYYPIIRLICAVPKEDLCAEYLQYAVQTISFQVPTSGIPQLTVPMVAKYKIPVPSMEIQKYTVSILDRFNTSCSDITMSLPAEIEARKKQYEYYRDKLLTFPEVNS